MVIHTAVTCSRETGWASLSRVLSKMGEASLCSYKKGSDQTCFTVGREAGAYPIVYVDARSQSVLKRLRTEPASTYES